MQLDSTFVAARIVGPVLIVAGVALIAHNEAMVRAIGDFIDLAGLLMLSGLVGLTAGLALVTLHRRWDSFTAILISMIGWIAVLRGAATLLLPDLARTEIILVVTNPQVAPIVGCVLALIGVWLTYAGYIAGIFRVEPASRRLGL
jgi:hypothetical protein